MVLNIHLPQRIVLALCAAMIALSATTLILTLFYWQSDWSLAHKASQQTTAPSSRLATDMIAAIPSYHLFGKSLDSGGEVPITSLQLSITGIVKIGQNDHSEQSKAYISIAGEPSKIYQVGDHLPYGVKIANITDEAVMLENNGHLEKLPLARETLQFKPQSSQGIG